MTSDKMPDEKTALRRRANLCLSTMGAPMPFVEEVIDLLDEIKELEARIAELIAAGDALYYLDEYKAWDAAKEEKP